MRKSLMTFLCAALALGATVARAAEVKISGKTLTIKDNANPLKKKATFLSKDPTFTVGSLDPTTQFTFVQFSNPVTFEASTGWSMPPSLWTAKNGKFTYKDKTLTGCGDPPPCAVSSALMKNGQIKISAKSGGMNYGLFNWPPQQQLRVNLYVGGTSVCTLFPGALGKLKKDDPVKGVFSATNAEAPAACN